MTGVFRIAELIDTRPLGRLQLEVVTLCALVALLDGFDTQVIAYVAPAIAEQWGASTVLNARGTDVVQTVQQMCSGGAPAVIDAVGATPTRAQAVQAVVPGGRVVFIGLHDEESPLATNYLIRQEITITGCFSYSHQDFAQALTLLKAGIIQPAPDWLEERPLAAGPASFAELVKGTARATKIVLRT